MLALFFLLMFLFVAGGVAFVVVSGLLAMAAAILIPILLVCLFYMIIMKIVVDHDTLSGARILTLLFAILFVSLFLIYGGVAYVVEVITSISKPE